jgi:hypothetical protein
MKISKPGIASTEIVDRKWGAQTLWLYQYCCPVLNIVNERAFLECPLQEMGRPAVLRRSAFIWSTVLCRFAREQTTSPIRVIRA